MRFIFRVLLYDGPEGSFALCEKFSLRERNIHCAREIYTAREKYKLCGRIFNVGEKYLLHERKILCERIFHCARNYFTAQKKLNW